MTASRASRLLAFFLAAITVGLAACTAGDTPTDTSASSSPAPAPVSSPDYILGTQPLNNDPRIKYLGSGNRGEPLPLEYYLSEFDRVDGPVVNTIDPAVATDNNAATTDERALVDTARKLYGQLETAELQFLPLDVQAVPLRLTQGLPAGEYHNELSALDSFRRPLVYLEQAQGSEAKSATLVGMNAYNPTQAEAFQKGASQWRDAHIPGIQGVQFAVDDQNYDVLAFPTESDGTRLVLRARTYTSDCQMNDLRGDCIYVVNFQEDSSFNDLQRYLLRMPLTKFSLTEYNMEYSRAYDDRYQYVAILDPQTPQSGPAVLTVGEFSLAEGVGSRPVSQWLRQLQLMAYPEGSAAIGGNQLAELAAYSPRR